jgi:peptidyl-prolyl cis-trans isomerase SurA
MRTARGVWALLLVLAGGAAGAADDGRVAGVAPAAPVAKGQPVDRIVAIVNDEVITAFELQQRQDQVLGNLRRQGTPLPEIAQLRRQVLERLINDTVQAQIAKQTGLRVDDSQLDQALQRIARENNMSLEAFRAAIEKEGMSFARFRDDIRLEMLLGRLREREVDNKIIVTDAEVDAEIKTEQARGSTGDEYLVSHILVTVPEQATPEQIQERRKRAAEALSLLKQGKEFATVAASYSDAGDAVQGGSLGWRPTARLPTVFAEAVGKLEKGEVSEILRSGNGFHVVKLVDKRGKSVAQVVTQFHVRHILLRTGENISVADTRTRAQTLKERIDNGDDFGNLARANSDDDSKSRGGDLGWLSPGDTVPEFERALAKLEPGKTAVLESPVGVHVVQMIEKREADISQDRQKVLARQSVRARKSDEAFQDWLRQLRDGAYVEYRLDD